MAHGGEDLVIMTEESNRKRGNFSIYNVYTTNMEKQTNQSFRGDNINLYDYLIAQISANGHLVIPL